MNIRLFLTFLLIVGFLTPTLSASAAVISGGDEFTLTPEESIEDDAYLGGGTVVVSGTVTDDLAVAGGSILINGSVGGDALLAGGDVDVLAPVADDVRVAGGTVRIGGTVGDDVVAAGGMVHFLGNASVNGGVLAVGGVVTIDGVVEGNIWVSGGTVRIEGTVNGDVIVGGADTVIIGEDAVLEGDLTYTSREVAEIVDGAIIEGDVVFNERSVGYAGPLALGVLFGTFGVIAMTLLVSMLIAAVLLATLFTRYSEKIVLHTTTHFWKELLRGLIIAICAPIILIILALTGIGFYVAIVLGLLYLLILTLASIYTGIVVGGYIARFAKKEVRVTWKWALLGVIALVIIKLIPFIGWIIACVLFLATLGAIARDMYGRLWLSR